jgi:hypothetical protein
VSYIKMADQSLSRSDQGSLGGPAPVRTRPSPRSPKALQYQFNRTEPHTLLFGLKRVPTGRHCSSSRGDRSHCLSSLLG